MKKSLKRFFLALVLFISVFALTGCGKKEALTYGQFYSRMSDKGYKLTDVKNQFENYKSISKAYVASSKDLTYQIEFYELSSEENAIAFYDNNKSIFEASVGKVVKKKIDINGKNYSKYNATSNGYYMVVSRIKNTVVFARIAEEHSEQAKKDIKELGY